MTDAELLVPLAAVKRHEGYHLLAPELHLDGGVSPLRLPDRPASEARSEPADIHAWIRQLESMLEAHASEPNLLRLIAQELDEAETWLDPPAH